MAALRFYLDENVQVAAGEQLRLRGIEAVSVRDRAALGESDQSHLARRVMYSARTIPIMCALPQKARSTRASSDSRTSTRLAIG